MKVCFSVIRITSKLLMSSNILEGSGRLIHSVSLVLDVRTAETLFIQRTTTTKKPHIFVCEGEEEETQV